MSLLGIDVGSSSCKGMAFSPDGEILGHASRDYAPCCPLPGHMEMDARLMWDALVGVTRELGGRTEADPIEAFAISSHGETFVPVDSKGQAVARAIMNSDNRAIDEAQWWEAQVGEKAIYQITGLPVHGMFALNKILWLKKNRPEIFSRAARFVSVADYLLMQMGLPPYTDLSLASRTMAFDIRRRRWSDEILSCVGIGEDRLGILMQAGQKAGTLTPAAATSLGLPVGAIVTLGGHDQACGALGAGVTRSGQVADSAGTYECLVAVSSQPGNTRAALAYNLNSYCHVVPEQYVTLAFFPAGIASRWFLGEFCYQDEVEARETGQTVHQVLEAKMTALGRGPTGICVTPHLVGSCNPYWDARATGAIVGLTPLATRCRVYKAIHEGIACELAINAEVLEQTVGSFERLRIYGGHVGSAVAMQLRADVTGKVIETCRTNEAVCQGAAMLAGISAGVYRNIDDAVARLAAPGRVFQPDPATAKRYTGQIRQYRRLYSSLEGVRQLQ